MSLEGSYSTIELHPHLTGGDRRYRPDLVAIIASDCRPLGLPPKFILKFTMYLSLATGNYPVHLTQITH